MALIIKKFGGTSLETTDKIKAAASLVKEDILLGNKVAVVVSAMAGVTNKLVSYCSDISSLSSSQSFSEYDTALSSGEIVSAALFALALQDIGINATSCQAWQIKINSTDEYSKAFITSIDPTYINSLLSNSIVPVITGFQGINSERRITTLGRGGSDTTAVAIAAAISADMCEIYTDVEGIYTADPRMVHNAKKIHALSYDEMLIFALCGAKVLHPRSVQIGKKFNIPIKVLSTFTKGSGTIIVNKENIMENSKITGIAYNNNIALIKINNHKIEIFQALCNQNISIENIFHSDNVTYFTVSLIEIAKMKEALNNYYFEINKDIAIVSLVSCSMNRSILTKIFNIIQSENILHMISSEVKLSLFVPIEEVEMLINKLHILIE